MMVVGAGYEFAPDSHSEASLESTTVALALLDFRAIGPGEPDGAGGNHPVPARRMAVFIVRSTTAVRCCRVMIFA